MDRIQNNLTQPNGSWALHHIEETGIPAVQSLSLRFSKNNDQQYRLDDIQLSGEEGEFTSLDEHADVPQSVTLYQNYPNPFNPSTSIQFELTHSEQVKLTVYDMLGREVSLLADGIYSSGIHTFNWNASNFSSGIYIYTLETTSRRITRKMTLMK